MQLEEIWCVPWVDTNSQDGIPTWVGSAPRCAVVAPNSSLFPGQSWVRLMHRNHISRLAPLPAPPEHLSPSGHPWPHLHGLSRSPGWRLPDVAGDVYCRPKREVGRVFEVAIHDVRWTAWLPWKGKWSASALFNSLIAIRVTVLFRVTTGYLSIYQALPSRVSTSTFRKDKKSTLISEKLKNANESADKAKEK